LKICDLSQIEGVEISRRAEFCIVGGGFAGLVVAWRLAKAGRKVVLIESGDRDPDTRFNELDASKPEIRYKGGAERYRGLGGTSAHWGGRLLPLTTHDLGPRPYLSIGGWPFGAGELDVYRPEIERLFGLDHSSYEVDFLDDIDSPAFLRSDPAVACRFPKIPSFSHRNLARNLKTSLQRHRDLEIWINGTACDFALDRDSERLTAVVALSMNWKRLTVSAETFFFAAGTLETTRLVLLLDALSEGHAFRRCTVLGRYFHDHLSVQAGVVRPLDRFGTNRLLGYRLIGSTQRRIHFELTPAAQEADAVASAYLDIRMSFPQASPFFALRGVARSLQGRGSSREERQALWALLDIGLLARAGYWRCRYGQLYLPADVALFADLRVEQVPQWQNRLTLSQRRDAFGVPILKLDWSPTELEEKTFRSAYQHFRSYWQGSGFEQNCPVEWDLPFGNMQRIVDQAEDALHPSGSTRMGLEPTFSVVDGQLRCHHVHNLSIASAATFPSSGSANPSLTIMQLALRAADSRLKEAAT
jgi:choline dehydrogenase-like flavoprotein